MIVDHISNAGFYHALSPRLATAFKYLASTDFSTLPQGKTQVQGDDVFALVQTYDTRQPGPQAKWEAHQKYIDIQFVVKGHEKMGYGLLDAFDIFEPYKPETDLVFFKEKPGMSYDYVPVSTGMFTVFGPHDVHLPGMATGVSTPVSKVVMKVRV